jgi:acetolactate synthase-1/2/3 large subunit
LSDSEFTVGDLIESFLAHAGARAVFGIVSIHNLPIADAIGREDRIRWVCARGEMGAAHMADGYARARNSVGVVVTSTGPGAANAVGGLVEAQIAGTPLLHFTGQTPIKHISTNRGVTHDVSDQLGMLRSVGKAAYRLDDPTTAADLLVDAWRSATSFPTGPVSIEIPIDIQRASAPRPNWPLLHPELVEGGGDEAAVPRLIDLIRQARRPMLWVGTGARAAAPQIEALLNRGFRMVSSWHGRGIIAEDDPRTLGALNGAGSPALESFYESVDLMLIVGSRLRGQETIDFTVRLPERRVQIDLDPAAEGRSYPTEHFVAGDAADILDQVIANLGNWSASPAFAEDFAIVRSAARETYAKELGPYQYFAGELRAAAPRDALWVRDLTIAASTWGHRLFEVYHPEGSIYPVGAAIGPGLALAIGAAVGAGGSKVILLTGDGGFFVNFGELWTLVQERANVTVIVMNDGGYGVIRQIQTVLCDGRTYFDDLASPDFASLARMLDIPYRRVGEASAFANEVSAAVNHDGPALVEVDVRSVGAIPPYYPYRR